MFQVHRANENRIDITMSGKLDSEKMAKALDDLLEKSQGIEHGQMLFDVVNYHVPSFGAIQVELARLPTLFRWMKHFERAAVLTDKQWIKTVSELKGGILPGMTIKGFDRDAKQDAIAWLEQADVVS